MIEDAWPQAAFDPRILSIPLIGQIETQAPGTLFPLVYTNLKRGYIKQDRSYYAGSNAPVYACAFLYNPSKVETTYSLDAAVASLTLPQYYRAPDDTGVYRVGLATTVNFDLLFDRTYEVNSSVPYGPPLQGPVLPGNLTAYPDDIPDPGNSMHVEDPRRIGVQADVNALKRICGITSRLPGVQWTDEQGNTNTSTLTGPMQQIPAWVHFGDSHDPNSLSYFGFISGMNVQYTHFTTNMAPYRCAVGINFTLMPQVG